MRENAVDIIIDPHGFVFDTEHTFRGLTISETSNGWNCIIRATDKAGSPVYCMSVAEDPQYGLNRLYQAVSLGNGSVMWRFDKFASARGGG